MRIFIVLISMLAFSLASAQETSATQAVVAVTGLEKIKQTITQRFSKLKGPSLEVDSVSETVIPEIYQVETNRGLLYMNNDGSYFFTGDLIHITEGGEFVNLGEEYREKKMAELNPMRKNKLTELSEDSMLVYSPKGTPKASIAVFTDIDCGFCRKFHLEIPELNKLGIEVKYLAFPRAGKDSNSYKKIVSAWCADNPQDALTKAKNNEEIPENLCDKSKHVDEHMALVREFGINGTPALVKSDGSLIPGYMPAGDLAMELGVLPKPEVNVNDAGTQTADAQGVESTNAQ